MVSTLGHTAVGPWPMLLSVLVGFRSVNIFAPVLFTRFGQRCRTGLGIISGTRRKSGRGFGQYSCAKNLIAESA